MNLSEIDSLIADTKTRLAPLEVPSEEREGTMKSLEIGMYPGDQPDTYLKAGRKEFEQLKTERQPLVDQVKRARVEEQALKDKESAWGQIKQFGTNLLAPHELMPSQPVQLPTQQVPKTPLKVDATPGNVVNPVQKSLQTSSRFHVDEGEIIDTKRGMIITPEVFNKSATSDEKAEIERQLQAGGHLEPDPETHYDMAAAVRNGIKPAPYERDLDANGQPRMHWDSRFKMDTHPNRFLPSELGIFDTKYSEIVPQDRFDREATPDQKRTVEDSEEVLPKTETQGYLDAATQSPLLQPLRGTQTLAGEQRPPAMTPESLLTRFNQDGIAQPELFAPGITKKLATAQPGVNPLDQYKTAEPYKPLSLGQAFEESGKAFLRGIGHTGALTLKGIGILRYELDNATQPETAGKLDDYSLFKAGTRASEMTERLFPGRTDLKDNFLLTTVPQALGSSVLFYGAGTAGAAVKLGAGVSAALPGALVGGASLYEKGKDTTPEKRRIGLFLGGLLGATEGIPIAHLFKQMDSVTGGSMTRALKVGTVQAIEEAVQEGVQQLGENVTAKFLFKNVQGLTDDVATGMGAGGMVGFLTGAIMARKGKYGSTLEQAQPVNGVPSVATPEMQPKPSGSMTSAPFSPPPKPKQPDLSAIPNELQVQPAGAQRLIKKVAPPVAPSTSQPVDIPQNTPEKVALNQLPINQTAAVTPDAIAPTTSPTTTQVPISTELVAPKPPLQPASSLSIENSSLPPVSQAVTPEDMVRGAAPITPAVQERVYETAADAGSHRLAGSDKNGPYYFQDVAPPNQVVEQPKQDTGPTVQDIHAAADAKHIPWDNAPGFMDLTARVTGKRHLDELSPEQLQEMHDVVGELPARKPAASPPVAKPEVQPPVTPTDIAAHDAATSPHNTLPAPTPDQISAGNYQKGHVSIAGLDIAIENPQGSTRSGTDKAGKPWSITMQDHYGYIKGTVGKDKDHIDLFVKPGTPEDYAGPVFVVDQQDPTTKRFDEHKTLIGPKDATEARALYQRNYAKDWKGLGSMSTFTMPQFKEWLKSGDHTKPAVNYKVPKEVGPPMMGGEVLTGVHQRAEEATRKLEQHKNAVTPETLPAKPETKAVTPETIGTGNKVDVDLMFPPRTKGDTGRIHTTQATPVPSITQLQAVVHPEIARDGTLSKTRWTVSEVTSGAAIGHGDTAAQAIQSAQDAMRGMKQEDIERIVTTKKLATDKIRENLAKKAGPRTTAGMFGKATTPEHVAEKPKAAPIAVPTPNFQDRRSAAVHAEKAFKNASTPAEKQKYLDQVSGLLKEFKAHPGRIDSADYRAKEKFFADTLSRMNGAIDKTHAVTPEALATSPTKGATITPEEVSHDRPHQPRVDDSRPPERAPTEDVPGLKTPGHPQRDRPADAKSSELPDAGVGERGPLPARSVGDREGRGAPADRAGRPEPGGDATAVQRSDDDLPAGTDFILDADYQIPKGQKTKYKANVDAITLLKSIEADGRLATPHEQAILAQYTGWGGLPQAFQWSNDWQKEYRELEALLTDEEYEAARASTPNAHYTNPDTIRAIYHGLQHLGMKGGRVLEPGAGIGHFFGAMPPALTAHTQRTAIERDSLSARLAKQLYQQANILETEYQKSTLPENFFDVIVGNVPFADVKVFDPHNKDLSKLNLSLHDYYFAKALSHVRPGGLIAFITSRYTMDKLNGKTREYLAKQADLIGAIRLPDTQFKEIANTDVVTDILVLQKRDPNTPAGGQAWAMTTDMKVGKSQVAINEYFHEHPEMVLGTPSLKGSMYREDSYTVSSDGRDMNAALTKAFESLPEKILRPRAKPASTTPRGLLEALQASDDVKEGAYTIQNHALYVRRGGQFVPVENIGATELERAKGLIGIREQVRDVFKTQLQDSSEAVMSTARKDLTKLYDRFVKKFGPIHGRANKGLFKDDPDYSTLQALEKTYDPKTNTATKADIFTKRVIEYRPKAHKTDTPKEAMLVSLNETGSLDFDRMEELTGKSPDELQRELRGLIFKDPSGDWQPADAYLSGNIRTKLKAAEAAATIDPRFKENVDALTAVIPTDLAPTQIEVKLGHGWIPTKYYEAFIGHLLGSRATVNYNAHVGAYAVKTSTGYGNTKNDTVYGTHRYTAVALLDDALASKIPTVYDTVDDKKVVNQKETLAAREKLQKIQDEFRDWLWKDATRAKDLARLYNDEFNNVRLRDYDGSHLTLPGINPLITLRPHQKHAIWRALQSGNTLLGHVVGAGKTYTMIGIALEARRLRMANKPMFVVPNHLTEYWRKAIISLYPAAKVLTPAKQDFEAANRKRLLGRISTGDWDAVVVAHSQLTKVPVSLETFEQFVNEQVAVLASYLEELKQERGDGNRNIIKEIEKAKERFETKLERRKAEVESKADLGVSFEETGVDMLLVDESDIFKNLYFPTRMTRVAGIPNTESQRAYDMFLKTQYINKITQGRNVIFATGTPISNSMAEVFTMQRYLQPHMLEQAGLSHFDAWARQFGNTVTSMELAPDGSGYRPRTRFAEFVNVPELTQMFRQVMDVKLADELKLPVPKLKTGKPINVTSPPSEALKAYTMTLIERAKHLRDPRVDNMLKITGDGRNAALDIRLRVPGAPEDKNGKVAKLVHNVVHTYKDTTKVKGTQLVFLDLSTPKGEGKAKKTEETETQPQDVEVGEETALRGSVYQDIKRKLIKGGIPEKEIAFIHDADTDAKKDKLFGDVNAGTVRVLIGSTEKMGAGTNVQKRMVALHNLDAPWRPRDIEQRNGRGIRQGNELYDADPEGFEFAVYNYATEAPSFDVYMWQTLEVKAKTIAQVMKGDPNVRTVQDVDASVLSYAEMKAIASGNPMILERVKVETELHKLKMLKSQQRDEQHKLSYELATIPGKVAASKAAVAAMDKDKALRDAHPEEPFSMTIEDTTYDDIDEAGKKLLSYVTEATSQKRSDQTDLMLGTYRGFTLRLKVYLDGDALLFLKRTGSVVEHRTTAFNKDANAGGLIDRLNNALNKMEQTVQDSTKDVAKQTARETELKAEIGKPFEKESRLQELQTRMADIDKQLDLSNKDENVVIPEGPAPSPLDILKEERGSIPVSPFKGPAFTKEAREYKALRAKQDLIGFSSSDEDIESRVRAAKHGLKPEGLWSRMKEHSATVWHLVSREFEHLPDTAQFSRLRTDLLQLAKYKGIAADRVQRDLAAIIKPLSRKQYDQFEWKALLSDLVREAQQDRALPFGYTKEKVEEDLDRLNQVMERDPVVQAAWTKRQELWKAKKLAYQTAMDAIGFDTSKKLTKDDYFRHQVLEHSRERQLKGTGAKVRTPTGRGFLKARHGSVMDINANYVQAEFEVMAQMVYDTQLAKVIRHVDEELNIRPALEQEAKARNADALQRKIDDGGVSGAIIESTMKDFRDRIGMHMGMARKALELDKHERISLAQLAQIADDPDSPANLSARGVFKAISERKAYVKDLLGHDFKTWDQLVPNTHDLWQPREGNVFYMADSIPAQLAKALQEGMLTEAGLDPAKLQKILAMGNKREQYVIPHEAKATLDALSQKEKNWFVDANRSLLSHWKQLMLIAPRKVIRYNVRNFTGDGDALSVGNPAAFLKLRQAAAELIPVIFKDTVLTGEVKEWAQRGGYGTTLQWQELGDINDLKAFKATLDRQSKGGVLSLPSAAWNAYWKTARLSTDYREAMMRYAAYLSYLEQMQADPKGKPKNFGASIPATVMALPDLRDRAFKMSNELLGAYDRVSVAGQTIRQFWIPFWSWQEVNATRYARLIRNADPAQMSRLLGVGATRATVKAAFFLIKLSLFWSMLQAWNLGMYGDDEDELRETNPTVANRPHILFGRGEDGKIRYLAGIGALGDLLAWFGLDSAPGLVGDVMHDRMTIGEAFKHAVQAPVNKVLGGLTPTLKMPVELLSRLNFYPDVFHPRPIQDRGDYLGQQTTLGPEINKLRGKPGKPLYGGEDVTGLLIQRADPKASAYGTWQGIEQKYLERMGKESSSLFWRSPRGEALSHWSRAIKDEDQAAELHWKGRYEELEREKYGHRFSQTTMMRDLEKSLRAKAPLAGVTKAEREAIVSQLDAQEKRTLEKAEQYYEDVILQVLPETRRHSFTSRLRRQHWLSPSVAPHELTP